MSTLWKKFFFVLFGVVCASYGVDKSLQAQTSLSLYHIHGLGYNAEGTKLLIPMHYGLAVYEKGKWSRLPGEAHDYMGFVTTEKAFYSSGHPAQGSSWKNPLGLIKSQDEGQTWELRGLMGESDFHWLAASFYASAIYVFTPAPNSKMPVAGFYFSSDEGQTWKARAGKGIQGSPIILAVHPSRPQWVAVGHDQGIFLSEDGGESFQPKISKQQGLGVFFDLEGEGLWVSTFDGRSHLSRIDIKTGAIRALVQPELERDAVIYLAQNPKKLQEWAIATHRKNVYLSQDGGATWMSLAQGGQTQNREITLP